MVLESGKEEYVMEALLDWMYDKEGMLCYRVRWKGYGKEEDTWERAEKMMEVTDAFAAFQKEHPDVPIPHVSGKHSKEPNNNTDFL